MLYLWSRATPRLAKAKCELRYCICCLKYFASSCTWLVNNLFSSVGTSSICILFFLFYNKTRVSHTETSSHHSNGSQGHFSMYVFVAGSGRWIHMDHLSHYGQPHPPQARDMTYNHHLCGKHYNNHVTLLYIYGLCKDVYNEVGCHIDVVVVPCACRWMIPSSSYKFSLCNPWLPSMAALSPFSPFCTGSNSSRSNSSSLIGTSTWLRRRSGKWTSANIFKISTVT